MDNRPKNTFAWLTITLFALVVAVQCTTADSIPATTTTNPASDQHHAVSDNNVSTSSAVPAAGSVAVENVSKPITAPVTNNASTNLIPIEVYYEALCSDSVKFISSELSPVHKKLSKFINVTFVPFAQGIISFNDNKTSNLTCKRSSECDADKVHACGINKITDSDKLFKFVSCALTEGLKSSKVPIDECGKNSSIDSELVTTITLCANSSESEPWLQNYMNMSSKAQVKTVPKVLIYQVAVATEDLTSSNLMKAVCARIPEKDLPVDCKTVVNGSETLIVGVLPIIIGAFYILKMI